MKFISSYYNEEKGYSEVVVQHLGVKFTGKAQVHPEEKNPSEYAGCQYAEIRAEIAALKYERKIEKQKTDTIISFLKACKCYKYYNMEDDTSKVLHRQLNKNIDKVNSLTDEIDKRYKELNILPKKREVTIKAIQRKRRTKEDNSNK